MENKMKYVLLTYILFFSMLVSACSPSVPTIQIQESPPTTKQLLPTFSSLPGQKSIQFDNNPPVKKTQTATYSITSADKPIIQPTENYNKKTPTHNFTQFVYHRLLTPDMNLYKLSFVEEDLGLRVTIEGKGKEFFISKGEETGTGEIEFSIDKVKYKTTYGSIIAIWFEVGYITPPIIFYAPSNSSIISCKPDTKTWRCTPSHMSLRIVVKSSEKQSIERGLTNDWCLNTEKSPAYPGLSPESIVGYQIPPANGHPSEIFLWGKDTLTGKVTCPVIEKVATDE